MSRLRSIPMLAALALLGACGTPQTPQAFDQQMTGYVGKPESELVAGLGVPNRTYDADGRRLLQWDFVRPSTGPSFYPSIGLGFGSFGGGSAFGLGTGLGVGPYGTGSAPRPCSLVFETRSGTVQGFNRNGPGCVA